MSTTETTRIITVTDAAAAKVAALIVQQAEQDGVDAAAFSLRVAVRPGGCSGFSYDMYFDDEVAEDDSVDQVADNVRVVVDSASAQMLAGATLDYTDGLNASGFNIINPNASRSCGCGNSFS